MRGGTGVCRADFFGVLSYVSSVSTTRPTPLRSLALVAALVPVHEIEFTASLPSLSSSDSSNSATFGNLAQEWAWGSVSAAFGLQRCCGSRGQSGVARDEQVTFRGSRVAGQALRVRR